MLGESSGATARNRSNAYRSSIAWKLYDRAAEGLDRRVGWDQLPRPLALMVLIGLRNTLRRENLYDAGAFPSLEPPLVSGPLPRYGAQRTADGSFNDLGAPRMGMAGTRFGRNVPFDKGQPEPEARRLTPNPREVSRRLLTRQEFKPALSVNLLAASWLQFMVKDWLSHGEGDAARGYVIDLAGDDDWSHRPMLIPRTIDDPTRPAGDRTSPMAHVNVNSPWWDGSSIYGNSQEEQGARRLGVNGKLRVSPEGRLVLPAGDVKADPTQVPGFWLGLAMMAEVFVLEHNAVCERLQAENGTWTDEELFQRARLVVTALIAKIHTVEWTPAIISHPTTVTGLRANWFGLAGERVLRSFGRISRSEVLSGIPGSPTDHFGVPYSLTEEFSVVYRMHPLIPDTFSIRSVDDNSESGKYTFRELTGPAVRTVLGEVPMTDLLYSFGTDSPGALVLNNYPRFLQEYQRPDGKFSDLAATDILRSRELGVPRYNEFRRQLHLRPAGGFTDLTEDRALAATLREVYSGDIESVDTIVGMFAERRPQGFAFSDTAFRIFILMASRRLNSDRFLSSDFTPEVYSHAGFEWVSTNTMSSVLLRHYPALRGTLRNVANPFAPWPQSS